MKKILFLLVVSFIFVISCKKDKEPATTSQTGTNISQFNSKYAAPSQFFNVTAGQDFTVYGEKGTKIIINQYSFYPIMSGNIKIELKEYYSPKDIILNRLQTISYGQLLSTSGMIYVDVTQNGNAVNHWNFEMLMPANSFNPEMQIFFGQWRDSTGVNDSTINWITPDSNWVWYCDTCLPSSPNGAYDTYVNSSNRFQWINCDYFVNQTPLTSVSASITNMPQASYSPRVYMVLDINAIAEIYPVNNNLFQINNIPEGLTGKIVAYTVVNGTYYLCKEPITVTTNINKLLTFQIVTEQEIITQLENL